LGKGKREKRRRKSATTGVLSRSNRREEGGSRPSRIDQKKNQLNHGAENIGGRLEKTKEAPVRKATKAKSSPAK